MCNREFTLHRLGDAAGAVGPLTTPPALGASWLGSAAFLVIVSGSNGTVLDICR